jgi:hypothetical protein
LCGLGKGAIGFGGGVASGSKFKPQNRCWNTSGRDIF